MNIFCLEDEDNKLIAIFFNAQKAKDYAAKYELEISCPNFYEMKDMAYLAALEEHEK